MPLFRWTVTDGLQRLDIDLEPQTLNSDPTDVLKHIRAVTKPGIYILLDFHPFLDDPVHVRLLKDICIKTANSAAADPDQPQDRTAERTRVVQRASRHRTARRD